SDRPTHWSGTRKRVPASPASHRREQLIPAAIVRPARRRGRECRSGSRSRERTRSVLRLGGTGLHPGRTVFGTNFPGGYEIGKDLGSVRLAAGWLAVENFGRAMLIPKALL